MRDLCGIKKSLQWTKKHAISWSRDSVIHKNDLEGVERIKMEKYLNTIKSLLDLNGDNSVDTKDYIVFTKTFMGIWSVLSAILYTISGQDINALNGYWLLTFAFVAGAISYVYLMGRKKLDKKDKNIQMLKQNVSEQALKILQLERQIEEKEHQFKLELMEKDFEIKIKDQLVRGAGIQPGQK